MKKILLLLALFSFIAASSYAASSATTVRTKQTYGYGSTKVYTVAWTADESDGSFVGYLLEHDICGYVLHVSTNPGTTAPTDNYDVTLIDPNGADIMGGELMNRDATSSEQVLPAIGNSYGPRYVCGDLTLNITGNSINSATGEVILYVSD